MGGLNTFLVVALGALYGTSDTLANVALTGLLSMNALGVLVGGLLASRTTRHAAVAALALHGATWLTFRTTDELNARARRCASLLWWIVVATTVLITVSSFRLLPQLTSNFTAHPWGFVFPVFALAGLFGVKFFLRGDADALAFLASCLYLVGMLTSVAFSLYPNVLPASTYPAFGLTIANAKAADYGLKIGLIWWVVGMALAAAYTAFTYRHFAGKINADDADERQHF